MLPKQWMPLQKQCVLSFTFSDTEATVQLLVAFPQALQSIYLFSHPENAKCHTDSRTKTFQKLFFHEYQNALKKKKSLNIKKREKYLTQLK